MSRCSSRWACTSTPRPTRRRPPRCSAPRSTIRCAAPSPGSRSWAPTSPPTRCRTWRRPASSAARSSWSARTTARAPASSRSARTPSRSSPRSASSTRGPTLSNLARMVEEGFGMSEASNLPAVISLRIRAAHLRGSMVCKDNVRPAIGMLDRLTRHVLRLRPPQPPAVDVRAGGAEVRAAPARSAALRRRARAQRGDPRRGQGRSASSCRAGSPRPRCARSSCWAGPTSYGKSRIPLLVLNVIHPLVPEQLLGFLDGKQRVLVLEEGMPSFIEQELKALAYEHGASARIHGKDLVAAQGEYVPEVVLGALARFLGGDAAARQAALGSPRGARPRAPARAAAQAAARLLHGLPGASGVQRAQDRPARARARRTWPPTSAATPSPRCRRSTRATPSSATAWGWRRRARWRRASASG